MAEAIQILFEQKFGKEQVTLFKNRLDLVIQLLHDDDSKYKLTDKDMTDATTYSKYRNRMQSYVSQVLGGTGTRTITSEFRETLKTLIAKKLEGIDDVDVNVLSETIMKSLEERNVKLSEELIEFLDDFKTARYTAVFTSHPIVLEANPNEVVLKIREAFIEGVCSHFLDKEIKQKFRYNLPSYNLCLLFWRRVCNLLIKKLNTDLDYRLKLTTYLSDFYAQNPDLQDDFQIKIRSKKIPYSEAVTDEKKIKLLVDSYLHVINVKDIFQVFESLEPVFVIPHVVFNPNESSNKSGYIFLDLRNNSLGLYKYSDRDLTIWKDKVWNTLKANKKTNSVSYVESVEDKVTQV